ncbi:sensor histidine kinase [Acinetobacter wuhouensis]|uniref:histidine kinase n=1 Tax=Acinetobacter wuhouensis TaxID=1879050 RepID=A0A3G2T357_9GAMM|nr:ATP-binding protein [Acinetobacter wuhouensis]AYO54679.1 histidine kinase [Acinetobacter wuhouensis]
MLERKKSINLNTFYYAFSFFLFLLFLLNPQLSKATVPTTTQNCQTNIHSVQIVQSDANNPSQIKAQTWENVDRLPDYWDKRWKGYHSSAWYKVLWTQKCPFNIQEPVTLTISHINMAGEIYLNDEFLWKDQSLVEPLSRSWHNPRYWILPSSSLKQGQNTLWIRVVGTPTQKSGLGPVHLGEHTQIMDIYKQAVLEKRSLPSLNLFVNLIVGLFCLIVWLFIRSEYAFKWFGFVTILWLIYSYLVLRSDPLLSLTSTTIDRFSVITFSIYASVGCIAAWRFAKSTFPKAEKILLFFCIFSTIIILFVPIQYLPTTLNLVFLIGVIIFILKCLTYPYIAYKSKLKEAYFLSLQYLFFFPIAINDAIYMLTLKGQILSPYTAPISTITVGLVLAYRLSNNAKSIAQFNKTLEQSVIQAKDELSVSLNNQHQLALENVKLQERIHFSHDLHDGLGGSISRSLILLEKYDHIEKDQMLSILKLLRNDLRQTIDFGSSQESQIPATPILWAAHIRHRFVMIFEEMEISSKWDIIPQWQSTPSTLQCLTLARVAEEALNNIVKHSQATEVKVSLYEAQQKLILEIEDNGIGFIPHEVEAGLHVGLHSMQQRVSRLNGQFEINSKSGQTILKVSLPFTA